jgi:glutathione S-transferase
MAAPLQLHGTPLSHFTRKIRILLSELGVPFDFVRERTVLAATPQGYGGNPVLRVPLLVDGDTQVFDSEHIARYLVARHDPADRFGVTTLEPDALNRQAALGTIMANEVVIILAERGGLTEARKTTYFAKLLGAIESGLTWLDERTVPDAPGFDWRDITLVCMWQHLAYYKLVPLETYPRLAARVARFATRPSIVESTPQRSLDDAAAAGWTPG